MSCPVWRWLRWRRSRPLSRVILLAPLVVGVAAVRRRRSAADFGGSAAVVDTPARRPPLLPLFVAGFLAAIVVRTLGVLPTGVLDAAASVQHVLLTAALVSLGTGIHVATLRRTAGRSLLLALISWVLVAGVAYAGVVLLGA